METQYYVILCRPRTCQCWTPLAASWVQSPAGNFFASPIRATEAANEIAGRYPPVWLAGEKRWTAMEFKVAQVVIERNVPDFVSPAPSPNRAAPHSDPYREPPAGADAEF